MGDWRGHTTVFTKIYVTTDACFLASPWTLYVHAHIPFTLACTLTLTPSHYPSPVILTSQPTYHPTLLHTSPTYFAPSLTSSPPHTLTPSSRSHWCSYLDGPCQDVSVVGQASCKGWAIIKRIPAGEYEGNPLLSAHTHAHTHTHIHAHVQVQVHTYTCTHTHTHMYRYKYKYTRTHAHIHMYRYKYKYTRTHAHTHQC